MTLKQNHPLQNLTKDPPPHPSLYQSQYQPEKRYKDVISNADNTVRLVKHCMQLFILTRGDSILTVRSLVCSVEAFSFESNSSAKQVRCENVDKHFRIPSYGTAKVTQESYCYLQVQFSHHSQRALGKYSSLQLTLKTIAQTTALRQKEVNYFCGCCVILAVPPTFNPSAFGEVDQFHKAF